MRKLLLSTNQSYFGYLIDIKCFFSNFLTELKKQMYDIEVTTLADMKDIVFSSFIFKENDIFIQIRRKPFRKSCYSLGRTR